ncbi:MAG: NAD(P)/FAD-dependent oxidoreductase [Thermoguttaceae bacterium]
MIVVGAGPAGLMAACGAAGRGRKTLLLEKNPAAGAKILLSGGTRSNLTHATDCHGIRAAFGPQGRFLHSALAVLGPEDVLAMFEAEGVATKVEAGGNVFPKSDRAADVLAALVARLERSGCQTALGEPVQKIEPAGSGLRVVTSKRTLRAPSIVLATGGMSYPTSGSTGDGYRWAAALGHTIVPPRPALVPITTHADWVRCLRGVTLPDVLLRVIEPDGGGCMAERRGALLFAHFGVTGPAALDVSRAVSGHSRPADLVLECDLAPDADAEAAEAAVRETCQRSGRRLAGGLLDAWLPRRVSEAIARQAGVAPARRAAELSRPERQALVRGLKQLVIPVAGTMGFRKAEVTAGGVTLEEVDSSTLQSKRVPGLYFAGEVLDLDGPIGGYNFQAAFSTGWLAGLSA